MTKKKDSKPKSQENPEQAAPEAEKTKAPAEDLAAELAKERDDLKDRLLRQAAELENFKKRSQREKTEFLKRANESITKDLLPVLDNMERALGHVDGNQENNSVIEGLNMIYQELVKVLTGHGLEPVKALGEPFNPEFHEAMMQEEDPEAEENTVIKELQKGYLFQDRLLRPSMVVVSKKPARAAGEEEQEVEIKVN
ncbi:nucleotide exchange factor GrpE [Dethiosulfatarculus sandiegensis]|uniref:nucleotide exchange factor GrpE n=1 Tax=Dethiosulfatarculus sandiegensis TaxID=1429043 RepID=UPI0005C7EB42|nr:nucleotide exchange factor GrpE [Dethiosulfatarculus sandiegensis]